MSAITNILRRIEEVTGRKPEQSSAMEYSACCPAHNDNDPSLSVTEGEGGKVLLHCHAGCSIEEILQALGLEMKDLFNNGGEQLPFLNKPSKKKQRSKKVYCSLDDAVEAARSAASGHGAMKETERYVYPDIRKQDYMAIVRFDPVDGKGRKTYRPFHPVEGVEGGWSIGDPSGPLPLFCLPFLSECPDRVYVFEGEKCVQAGYCLGLLSTTSAHGAKSAAKTDWTPLAGRDVIIVPDNDKAGIQYAEDVARILAGLNPPAEVRIIDPDELYGAGEDICDYIAGRLATDSTMPQDEPIAAIRAEIEAAADDTEEWYEEPEVEILDHAPDTVFRPLCMAGGYSHLVTYVYVANGYGHCEHRVILRGDGAVFCDSELGQKTVMPSLELGMPVNLPQRPKRDMQLSGAGLKAFMAGEIPHPVDVLQEVHRVVDHFMDFGYCFGSQWDMSLLVALYIMATYFLDSFQVIGYLWPNGDKGCGKTKLISIVTSLGYLGELITAGSSSASMRDLAANGAVLGFDDAENIMKRGADPDKRALMLAGNRKGVTVTLKEKEKDKWKTKYVPVYCPRVYSAINQPDDVLGSRTIVIPLVRSAGVKANLDPADPVSWPVGTDRRRMVDGLWLTGLKNMSAMQEYYRRVPEKVKISGRDLEPWRGVLAVALWLEESQGATGLFAIIAGLMNSYIRERSDIVEDPCAVVLVKALCRIRHIGENQNKTLKEDMLTFIPHQVKEIMCSIAAEEDIPYEGDCYVSAQKVGCMLKQQRFTRRRTQIGGRIWTASVTRLEQLARAYGVTVTDAEG